MVFLKSFCRFVLHKKLLLTFNFHDLFSRKYQEHDEERQVRAELDVRCQRYQVQIEELRNKANEQTYKNQNFDLIQRYNCFHIEYNLLYCSIL